MGKSLILSLQNGKLAAAVQDGAAVRGEALFPLEEDHSAEIAAMAAGAKFALCPAAFSVRSQPGSTLWTPPLWRTRGKTASAPLLPTG